MTSNLYRTFCYSYLHKCETQWSMQLGRWMPSDSCIFGTEKLDQWAPTLSWKDGCFQAHLLIVFAFQLPFPLRALLWNLTRLFGLFPSRLWTLSPKVRLLVCLDGIRSFRENGQNHVPPFSLRALPPASSCGTHGQTLYLYRFRRKPAISEFDWPFTPIHNSS